MNGVMIIPTGIGAELGGHAGDGNPAAKLLASCCDTLVTHPNVLNASDINEMTDNMLYVEGSALDRFLEGTIGLCPTWQNRVLVVANAPLQEETINAVEAARVTIGLNIQLVALTTPLRMAGGYNKEVGGQAGGNVAGWGQLVAQVRGLEFDALAIHSPIEVERATVLRYYREGGVNPWGGVEAMASRLISSALDKPVAHAPLENIDYEDRELYTIFAGERIDPRICPEAISNCYLHSVLKGLHRAPRLVNHARALWVNEVDFMVSPLGCWGRPHRACDAAGIPIIVVRENKTVLDDKVEGPVLYVENYWEAAGLIMTMRAGLDPASVRRPLKRIELEE